MSGLQTTRACEIGRQVIWLMMAVITKMTVILVMLAVSGCSPAIKELPQTDLVFQVHPADPEAAGALGFVNADGTGYQIIPHMMGYGMLPVWSPDGTQIAYRNSVPSYYVHYFGQIALAGKKACPKALSGNGRVHWMPDGSAVLTMIAESQKQRPYRYSIIGFDPAQCKVIEELYSTLTTGFIWDPDLSPSGLLAITTGQLLDNIPPAYKYSITVVDLNTKKEWTVGEGMVPSWSPDGEWLAYAGLDGIYIVRADGTSQQRVLACCTRCKETPSGLTWNDWPPLPEWSPDGKWLVYHREEQGQYAIYKLNLETRQETLVAEGGLNPDWRATPISTPEN